MTVKSMTRQKRRFESNLIYSYTIKKIIGILHGKSFKNNNIQINSTEMWFFQL